MIEPAEGMRLQPPSGFTDTWELSEAECDRDLRLAANNKLPLPAELASLLAR